MIFIKKYIYFIFGCTFFYAAEAKAQLLDSALKNKIVTDTNTFAGGRFNISQTPDVVIASIIKAFLGLLGVIFIILIIYAGFTWMTAGGEEEKVRKSKEIIKRSIIGLAIIIAAYAITAFVFKSLPGGGGIEMGE